jgi:putative flavoprotein involved in K+ transport
MNSPQSGSSSSEGSPTDTVSPRVARAARENLLEGLPVLECRRVLAGIPSTVLEGGDGPPIVLLHGPGAHAAHWFRVIPALVREHRVVAPDLPGHGSTELGAGALDATRVLAWLGDLIAQTCEQPPTVVGELVGGAIAARFAALRPDRLSRLVLVDSFGLQPFQPTPEFARALGEFGADPSAETHQKLWGYCAHDLARLRRQVGPVWEHFETYNVERARTTTTESATRTLMTEFAVPALAPELLARLAMPTTLIWGRHDLATPLATAEAASARHGWPLHVIEAANDAPSLEQPEAFVRVLRGVLGGPARAASKAPVPRGTSGSAAWPAQPDPERRRQPDLERTGPERREHVHTLVIGGGQAGLATSHFLTRVGIEHLVLERRPELGGGWHDRWDTFHLVAPNFCLLLPGMPYAGPHPDAFMPRDEVIEYVKAYAEFCAAPVRLRCQVERLTRVDDHFEARAASTTFVAGNVVLATGPYQRPKVPPIAAQLAPHIAQLHSHDYRRPSQLAEGGVLVVDSGQSGTQIAEELQRAGRDVFLAVSMCPGAPRRYRGRDIIWWLLHSFHNREKLRLPFPNVDDLPTPAARFACNPHCSGEGGGHDIHLRQFARQGMHLFGRLESAAGTRLRFSADLAERLTFADTQFDVEFRPLFDAYIAAAGVDAPPDDRGPRDTFVPPTSTELDLDAAGVRTVIWATGYRLDFGWVDLAIFDEWGYPRHQRGVTEQPGLYAVGLPWLYSEPSSVFAGVGADAAHIVNHLVKHRSHSPKVPSRS